MPPRLFCAPVEGAAKPTPPYFQDTLFQPHIRAMGWLSREMSNPRNWLAGSLPLTNMVRLRIVENFKINK